MRTSSEVVVEGQLLFPKGKTSPGKSGPAGPAGGRFDNGRSWLKGNYE